MSENPSTPKCQRCGAPLTADSPEGLCPRCLMALNLATQTDAGEEAGPHGTKILREPPSPADISKYFPQLEILECLGRGGMGVVYKARQPRLDRFVALKVLAPEKEKDPRFAERFTREAKALARLNHPNIVTVHDFGEVDGFYYLLMEFVDGASLRQLIQTKKISPEEALVIVPKICDALQYAHGQGVVHRDIKPENVLLGKQGRVKIADFGIAKIVGLEGRTGLTEAKQVIGTPHYMAPEQVEKPTTVDHRADIYSLGVVFYEMLTGELPLGKFAPPSQKVQVDVRLDEVVLRALEKEPALRYQQASEVKTHVETIAATSQTGSSTPPKFRTEKTAAQTARSGGFSLAQTPWQIWVVIAMLGLEGLGNLVSIPRQPEALIWLFAKCLFIAGLLLRWRPVFVLVLVVTAIHVLYFAASVPIAAILNLILLILVGSRFRYYFNRNRQTETDQRQITSTPPTANPGWSKTAIASAVFNVLGILAAIPAAWMIALILKDKDWHPARAEFISVVGITGVWLLLALAGIIFGIVTLLRTRRTGPTRGHGLAWAGIIFWPLVVLGLVVVPNVLHVQWGRTVFGHKQLAPREEGEPIALFSPVLDSSLGDSAYRLITTLAKPRRVAMGVFQFVDEQHSVSITIPQLSYYFVSASGQSNTASRMTWAIEKVTQGEGAWIVRATGEKGAERFEQKLLLGGDRPFLRLKGTPDNPNHGPETGLDPKKISWQAVRPTRSFWVGPGEWSELNWNSLPLFEASDEQGRIVARMRLQLLVTPIRDDVEIESSGPFLRNGDWRNSAELKTMLPFQLTAAERDLERKKLQFEAGLIPQSDYENAKTSRDIVMAQLNGNTVEVARLKLERAEKDFNRAKQAFDSGLIGQSEFDSTNDIFALAQIDYRSALQKTHTKAEPPSLSPEPPRVGELEFRLVANDGDTRTPADELADRNDRSGQKKLRVLKEVLLDSTSVASATLTTSSDQTRLQSGVQELSIVLKDDAVKKIAEITAANIGRRLAIVWRGRVLSAPTIVSPITGPALKVTGSLDAAEWQVLLSLLNYKSTDAARAQSSTDGSGLESMANVPPVVVSTQPVSGTKDVEPGVVEIRVRFSKEMTDGSWSWIEAWKNSMPEIIGPPRYESDHRTCVLKAKLEPGRSYAFWLNSETVANFKDRNGRSAVPYLLIFQTKQN